MSHRYRCYPDAAETEHILAHCADARFVWNLALEQAGLWRPGRGSTPSGAQRQRQLAEARQGSWLGLGSSSVQQQALRDFDQAMKNFFSGSHRRPRWRVKHQDEGFCVRDVKVRYLNCRWAEVQVPKHGDRKACWLRFRISRPLPSQHGMGRVTLDSAGRWHVSFSAPQSAVGRTSTGAAVGIDRGVTHAVATSDGQFTSPDGLRTTEKQRLVRLQRKLARQHKGSNRRARTRRQIARLRAREADRRKDWVEKTSTDVVRTYDLIVLEDLKVRNMVRSATGTVEAPGINVRQKAGLNRGILASGWSVLARRIEDKATASEVVVVKVPAAGTSQTCAACGYRHPNNRKSQAVFRCQTCGHEANADLNAANNILAAGRAVTGRGGLGHQPPYETLTTPKVAA